MGVGQEKIIANKQRYCQPGLSINFFEDLPQIDQESWEGLYRNRLIASAVVHGHRFVNPVIVQQTDHDHPMDRIDHPVFHDAVFFI